MCLCGTFSGHSKFPGNPGGGRIVVINDIIPVSVIYAMLLSSGGYVVIVVSKLFILGYDVFHEEKNYTYLSQLLHSNDVSTD